MMFDAQTVDARCQQSPSRVCLLAAVDQMRSQQDSRPQGAEDEHGDQPDGERPERGRAPVNPPRIGGDVSDEQHTYDDREQPVRAEPQVIRHQDGEDNRGEYGAGARPTRLADDEIFGGRITGHDAGILLRRRRNSLHLVCPDQADQEHNGEDHDGQQDDDPRERPNEEEGGEHRQDRHNCSQGHRDADQVGIAAHGAHESGPAATTPSRSG